MTIATEHLVALGFWAMTIGFWIGSWLASNKWSQRGDEGYPRVECRGKLYWVSRDDRPCVRCQMDRRGHYEQ